MPDHLIIGGDSAGGGLTLATALTLRDRAEKLPTALFLLSPWTDLTVSGDSIRTRADRDPLLQFMGSNELVRAYAGKEPLNHPYISPVFADLHDLPPTLIQVGSEEMIFDDSSRLKTRLTEAGVPNQFEEWDGMWHVFQALAPYVPEAEVAIRHIADFCNRMVPGDK